MLHSLSSFAAFTVWIGLTAYLDLKEQTLESYFHCQKLDEDGAVYFVETLVEEKYLCGRSLGVSD
jgi:hypothetical protein